jgi:ABC-2 type transport system permease protein
MLGSLRHTMAKEFITLLRDPTSRQLILGMPFLQVMIFSFAATMDVNNVNIAIVNDDSGRWSHEYVQRVEAASFVGQVIKLPSMAGVQSLIDRREVMLAIHIQPEFSRQLASGRPGQVQLLIDGRRANAGQITFSYLQRIANFMQIDMAAEVMQLGEPPQIKVRNWFNPNLEYRWFIVPGLVATLSMIPALLMSTLGVARDREMGTFDQLVVSPVSTMEIILSKTLPPVLAGMMSGFIVFLLAIFVFQLEFYGSLGLLFSSMVVFVFAIAGIGSAVSAICNTQQQAMMCMFTLTTPLFITSGFISPVINMPPAFQLMAQINPMRHFLDIVQGSFLKAFTVVEIWPSLWPMLMIAAVTLGVAASILRWRLQ